MHLMPLGQLPDRPLHIPAEKINAIVEATLHSKPAGQTHWSCRTMAKAQGVSSATVQRVWSGRGLKPHLVKTFKLSNDRRLSAHLAHRLLPSLFFCALR